MTDERATPPVEQVTVYTIGHSNHPISRFLALLRQHQIEVLVDVRSMPYSRFNPQFHKDTLRRHVEEAGMVYQWEGRLGGQQPELPPGVRVTPAFLAEREAYRQAIQALIALAAQKRVAIMCAEEDPNRCHRHRLIGQTLLVQSVRVLHIRGDGRLEEGRPLPEQVPFEVWLREQRAPDADTEAGGTPWS